MIMAFVNQTRPATHTLAERFDTFRANFAEASAKRAVFRKTIHELDALSNRDLADLGIHRSTIKAVAYEAAYGK